MKVEILREAGYRQALFGLGLSYGITSGKSEMSEEDHLRLDEIALKLSSKDGGHNKFLESIQVWLDITAPRYWWQEFDTYRVGCSKQSESTMHTIGKRYLEQADFAQPIHDTYLMKLNECVAEYNSTKTIEALIQLKNMLPEGFMQRRIVSLNYKVLRNILKQRKDHRLPEWKFFCEQVYKNLDYHLYVEDIELRKTLH